MPDIFHEAGPIQQIGTALLYCNFRGPAGAVAAGTAQSRDAAGEQ